MVEGDDSIKKQPAEAGCVKIYGGVVWSFYASVVRMERVVRRARKRA